ncbi:pilin [Pantoea graminicola]|nr:pilin [Pantoea sp. ARC607]
MHRVIINMRIFLAYLILLAVFSQVPSVSAATQGHGNVHILGSIIDTPCGISSESRYQSVDLSTLPVSTIINDGAGPSKPFRISLSDCLLPGVLNSSNSGVKFSITFNGKKSEHSLFSVEGEGSGVGIEITDKAGNVAEPGKAMPAYTLEPDSMDLEFNMRLKANERAINPGDYQSTISFKMDYY